MSSARTGAGTDVWGTPPNVIERVERVGFIALDPCCDTENSTSKVWCFTEEDDGLAQGWGEHISAGLVYVNFPYSKAAAWAVKCAEEAGKGVPIIVLCAARPDTRWWKVLWDTADAVAFWRGRLRFVGAPASAPFPSALFGMNVSQRRFKAAFDGVATTVLP